MKIRLSVIAALTCVLFGTVRASEPAKPTLIVVIVIDQLRGDYLEGFGNYFDPDGFNRFLRHGAWLSNAHYSHGVTATGPGHATILTGANPAVHGIVGNDWFEFGEKPKSIYCCGDDARKCLGNVKKRSNIGRSPKNLQADTLGDALKAATEGRSQVWSVAIKDRAAILTAGRHADGAVWWDTKSGRFVSSNYYYSELPMWIERLNMEDFSRRFYKTSWDRLLPEAMYQPRFLKASGNTSVGKDTSHENVFPKLLGSGNGKDYYAELLNSPFGNELVFEAARRAITFEGLGFDNDVDLLCMGLSSNDVVGHSYGPDSQEVMDCTLRTDKQLQDFISWLDENVGTGRYVIAISADHGVGPLPEYATALGYGAGRLDPGEVKKAINKGLIERYRPEVREFVLDVNFPWLYLDESEIKAAGLDLAQVAKEAASIARTYPGIEDALSTLNLDQDGSESTELRELVKNAMYPGRSGQVYLHWSKYWYKGTKLAGHGSAHAYDRHVPVLIQGPGIRPGRYGNAVDPRGLVPTLCALVGVKPPVTATNSAFEQALISPPK